MDSFPKNSLKPKNETNSLNFLKKFPEFDGRDCTIAVLDSGVSSLCADLRKLPNGDVKVIERFDCSGAGNYFLIAHFPIHFIRKFITIKNSNLDFSFSFFL